MMGLDGTHTLKRAWAPDVWARAVLWQPKVCDNRTELQLDTTNLVANLRVKTSWPRGKNDDQAALGTPFQEKGA